jgi:hypothetical protein
MPPLRHYAPPRAESITADAVTIVTAPGFTVEINSENFGVRAKIV